MLSLYRSLPPEDELEEYLRCDCVVGESCLRIGVVEFSKRLLSFVGGGPEFPFEVADDGERRRSRFGLVLCEPIGVPVEYRFRSVALASFANFLDVSPKCGCSTWKRPAYLCISNESASGHVPAPSLLCLC